MATWTCPACSRRFGRRNQTHECAPALTVEEYLSTGPSRERPIFEAVLAHLETLAPVQVEPVSVGIFLKRGRVFAELRPMRNWVALSMGLLRPVRHRLITRKIIRYHGRYHQVFHLEGPDDLDDEIRSWLTEAYLASDADA